MGIWSMVGRKFTRLTVLEESGRQNSKRLWKCRCDCGKITYVTTSQLRSGRTKSCGCYSRDIARKRKKHGYSNKSIYSKYNGMMNRCYNPKDAFYKNYGGRGIRVCDEWRGNVKAFGDWAYSNGFSDGCGLTLDRINPNGNYEPSNCRWVGWSVQANNKTNNRIIEFMGEKKNATQWSKFSGVHRTTISYRDKHGLPLFKEEEINENDSLKALVNQQLYGNEEARS